MRHAYIYIGRSDCVGSLSEFLLTQVGQGFLLVLRATLRLTYSVLVTFFGGGNLIMCKAFCNTDL